MAFIPLVAFVVVLVAWGGPVVLLFAERTRFLAPWILVFAVSGTGAAYVLGGAEEGAAVGILSAPSVVAVLIYLLLCWGFRSRVHLAPHRRTASGRAPRGPHGSPTPTKDA
ncbi:hypothetical protein ACH4SP_05360 [Streptomyces sp. NPDC021093]|uniref:hypothetical protein n=1 Tax=Streptomyces sp. NPDC021093 TaxID=3365112 RepID=UPI0037973877